MSEDWQFCFFATGLVAPEEGIKFGDMIILGLPPSHSASVFFKVPVKPQKNTDELRSELLNTMRNIAKLYGVVSNTYVEVISGSSSAKISSEHPFGDKNLYGNFTLIPVFDEERRRKQVPIIEKTIAKYEIVKPIFQKKSKRFLENAIDYYYRSLKDETLEEKLIDLMISLESLFSNEKDELGLRYSLRAAFLLSVGQEHEKPTIFRTIHILYGKRSEVVHGTEKLKFCVF